MIASRVCQGLMRHVESSPHWKFVEQLENSTVRGAVQYHMCYQTFNMTLIQTVMYPLWMGIWLHPLTKPPACWFQYVLKSSFYKEDICRLSLTHWPLQNGSRGLWARLLFLRYLLAQDGFRYCRILLAAVLNDRLLPRASHSPSAAHRSRDGNNTCCQKSAVRRGKWFSGKKKNLTSFSSIWILISWRVTVSRNCKISPSVKNCGRGDVLIRSSFVLLSMQNWYLRDLTTGSAAFARVSFLVDVRLLQAIDFTAAHSFSLWGGWMCFKM